MNNVTITTIVTNDKTGSVAVCSNSISFDSVDQLNLYVKTLAETKLETKLGVSIHRIVEGIKEDECTKV